ncbi:hypothetical protein RirG_157760 [Rhizophagus irregularis DAOM 197198w]|uniref:Myb/SANT-like DNA-binding domain-containing protein n=1 Tax=Rhizophagus irregularis (strain DAOM 197198w) TaxID=1432141 RepID=A0A015KSL1_RHIIW|nr:hypothetical protein RirG_157760 [Rhizophagus irregularis DAOM 197198w]
MAEWTHAEIRTLIDERRTRNDEFHNLGRNRERFWGTIASKINQENGISFSGHQCKEKFSNLVWDYNNFVVSSTNYPSCPVRLCVILCLVKVKPEVEQVHDILMNFVLTFGRDLRMNSINRGSGYITPIPSTRDVERELRSSERRLSRSSSISRSQSPPTSRRQSPSVSRRQSLPVRERRLELPPVSSLTTNDEMDISDTEQLVGQRRTSTHEELSLSLYPPPSYDIATAQESSNVRGNIQLH